MCNVPIFHSVSYATYKIFMPPATQNLLQDESIVQLYLRPINAFLGINKRGDVISTANFSDCDSECIMLVCYCAIIVPCNLSV